MAVNKNNRFTFLVGGEAGFGVRRAGTTAAALFSSMGRYCFEMDDYQSLIRGGHNFSVVTSAPQEVMSQYLKADVVVALDERSYDIHRGHVAEGGVLVVNSDAVENRGSDAVALSLTSLAKDYPPASLRLGVASIAVLGAAIGQSEDELIAFIRQQYPRDVDSNAEYARLVFQRASEEFGSRFKLEHGDAPATMLTGNQAIALGAYAGGLDAYFAYPMTPSSSILHYLAGHAEELGVLAVHPESEIAVMNMALGAASMGPRAMVGSSGGGVALMEEAMSLAGMAEVPIMVVLSSRSGPSTGVPTYTEQGDLMFALNQGHGEFPRVVASPGSVREAYSLAALLMGIAWRYQVPAILLTEKHMSESGMTVPMPQELPDTLMPLVAKNEGEYKRYANTEDGVSPLLFPPSDQLIKWTSYEHDELGLTTEAAGAIASMHEKRNRKRQTVVEAVREMNTVNRFGSGKTAIVTYGSTTMSVREALLAGSLEAEVVQPVFLEPFPSWEIESLKERNVVVVEQSCAAQLATLLEMKTGIKATHSITQYDGRPFDPDDLADRLREVLRG
ncbi:MAG: 2-oxoacid:acceptor oxidoreductase subunit alpha [Chloroflexota bacterium]